MSTTTIEVRNDAKSVVSQAQKYSKPIMIALALMISGVGVYSFISSKQQATSQQAMSDYYAAHKALVELSEKNKWEFQKLNVDESLSSVLPLYRKLFDDHPKSKATFLGRTELAQFYVNHGEPEKAIAHYEANLKSASGLDVFSTHFAWAVTLELMGRCSDAKPHYEKSFNSTQSTFKTLAQEGITRCVK